MIAPKQGDIYLVTLDPTIGTEMAKTRPGVIVSNDHANKGSIGYLLFQLPRQILPRYIPLRYFYRSNLRPGLTMIRK